MNPTIISYETPNEDVEYLRSKAELNFGVNWSSENFYTKHNTYLYTVGYVDSIPRWVCLLQQHKAWKNTDIVGLARRAYTDYTVSSAIEKNSLGFFGEGTFLQQYKKSQELGLKRIIITHARKSFVRSTLSRLERYIDLSGEKWYTSYNLYNTIPGSDCYQYCMWNNTEECFFERKT